MFKTEEEHRRDIIEICRRIYARGWIAASDGNVSVRLPRDRVLTTPTRLHKGFIKERDLSIIDMKGRLLSGRYGPSSEVLMHLECYKLRPEVNAVVHAHSTYCVAFSLAGVSLAKCMLPEVVFTLGSIPTAAYSTPATEEVPGSIRGHIKDFDAVILERHGTLTVGQTIFDAYNLLERIEHVAEITHAARQLGRVNPLSSEQVEKLRKVAGELGYPERKILKRCESCKACPSGRLAALDSSCMDGRAASPSIDAPTEGEDGTSTLIPDISAELKEIITREVARELATGAERRGCL